MQRGVGVELEPVRWWAMAAVTWAVWGESTKAANWARSVSSGNWARTDAQSCGSKSGTV